MNRNAGRRAPRRVIWADRQTCIVMRGPMGGWKAVQLTAAQFTIFLLVRQHGPMPSTDLVDRFYAGACDPPDWAVKSVYKMTQGLNRRLAHLGLTVARTNRRNLSTVRLEEKR